jgi:hypothetical protein
VGHFDGAEKEHAIVFAHGVVDGPRTPRRQDKLTEHNDDEGLQRANGRLNRDRSRICTGRGSLIGYPFPSPCGRCTRYLARPEGGWPGWSMSQAILFYQRSGPVSTGLRSRQQSTMRCAGRPVHPSRYRPNRLLFDIAVAVAPRCFKSASGRAMSPERLTGRRGT